MSRSLLVACVVLLDTAGLYIPAAHAADVAENLAISGTTLGLTWGSYGLGAVAGALGVAGVRRFLNLPQTLALGAVFVAVGLLLTAGLDSLLLLGIGRGLHGAGGGLSFVAGAAWIVEGSDRSLGLSAIPAAGGAGVLVGPLIGAYLPYAFEGSAACLLALALALAFHSGSTTSHSHLPRLHRALWVPILTMVAVECSVVSLELTVPFWLNETHHLDVQGLAWVFVGMAVVSIAGTLGAQPLLTRWGFRPVLVGGLFAGLIGFLGLGTAVPVLTLPSLALCCIGWAVPVTALLESFTRLPDPLEALALGSIASLAGFSLGAPLGGLSLALPRPLAAGLWALGLGALAFTWSRVPAQGDTQWNR